MTDYSEKLFSYGTLQYDSVQIATFGRKLNGHLDALVGYTLSQVEIKDPGVLEKSGEAFHPVVTYTGNKNDIVQGVVFEVSPEEIAHADDYEVDDYKRVNAPLRSGEYAWVYVNAG